MSWFVWTRIWFRGIFKNSVPRMFAYHFCFQLMLLQEVTYWLRLVMTSTYYRTEMKLNAVFTMVQYSMLGNWLNAISQEKADMYVSFKHGDVILVIACVFMRYWYMVLYNIGSLLCHNHTTIPPFISQMKWRRYLLPPTDYHS